MKKIIYILATCLATSAFSQVTVNGREVDVSPAEARDAFRELGEAMIEGIERSSPGDRVIDVDLSDRGERHHEVEHESEPAEHKTEDHDDFDFDHDESDPDLS